MSNRSGCGRSIQKNNSGQQRIGINENGTQAIVVFENQKNVITPNRGYAVTVVKDKNGKQRLKVYKREKETRNIKK